LSDCFFVCFLFLGGAIAFGFFTGFFLAAGFFFRFATGHLALPERVRSKWAASR
jgi:hypothetical protein